MEWKIEFFESFTDSMQPLLEIAEKKRSIENWNEEMMRSYRIAESFISQAISEAYKRGKHDGFAEEGVNCDKHCEEARAEERVRQYEISVNQIKFIKNFKQRCPQCGEKGNLTYQEALNANALFGLCFKCNAAAGALST